jgi:CspA family cold shock protein
MVRPVVWLRHCATYGEGNRRSLTPLRAQGVIAPTGLVGPVIPRWARRPLVGRHVRAAASRGYADAEPEDDRIPGRCAHAFRGQPLMGVLCGWLASQGHRAPGGLHHAVLVAQAGAAEGDRAAAAALPHITSKSAFGFITPDEGGKDVVCPRQRDQRRGLQEPGRGARVEYEVEEGPRGPQARNVGVVASV